jgi:hypothetical protein
MYLHSRNTPSWSGAQLGGAQGQVLSGNLDTFYQERAIAKKHADPIFSLDGDSTNRRVILPGVVETHN